MNKTHLLILVVLVSVLIQGNQGNVISRQLAQDLQDHEQVQTKRERLDMLYKEIEEVRTGLKEIKDSEGKKDDNSLQDKSQELTKAEQQKLEDIEDALKIDAESVKDHEQVQTKRERLDGVYKELEEVRTELKEIKDSEGKKDENSLQDKPEELTKADQKEVEDIEDALKIDKEFGKETKEDVEEIKTIDNETKDFMEDLENKEQDDNERFVEDMDKMLEKKENKEKKDAAKKFDEEMNKIIDEKEKKESESHGAVEKKTKVVFDFAEVKGATKPEAEDAAVVKENDATKPERADLFTITSDKELLDLNEQNDATKPETEDAVAMEEETKDAAAVAEGNLGDEDDELTSEDMNERLDEPLGVESKSKKRNVLQKKLLDELEDAAENMKLIKDLLVKKIKSDNQSRKTQGDGKAATP